ncbi:hypothetical protein PHSY_004322 [Pseudozyma hubeiensis SY62]|uniref:Uncharacterized protein n=1 Tax=Pseudozyma hubeiensis (strain SY62) TaxID=1305764 RepID=R9P5P8_PSEHS|nr:hypothetical protein PHSY_004322 [Pseudozyma hubeiensis SY62]GAC96738.1 hypothetical protein PHSY_004322 [Pseudozyma hubeiensis SY62]
MHRIEYLGHHEDRPRVQWHFVGIRRLRQHGPGRCDRVVSIPSYCRSNIFFTWTEQADIAFLLCALRQLNSETSPDGKKKKTKLGQTLLNGNNICMLIPGSEGPEDS